MSVTLDGVSSTPRTSSALWFSYEDLVMLPTIASVTPLSDHMAGNTTVVITGTRFHGAATVYFVAADSSGAVSADAWRGECVWKGVPDMVCNDTYIRCAEWCLGGWKRHLRHTSTAAAFESILVVSSPLYPPVVYVRHCATAVVCVFVFGAAACPRRLMASAFTSK